MSADPHLLPVLVPALAVCSTVILLGPPELARRARLLLALLLGSEPDHTATAH